MKKTHLILLFFALAFNTYSQTRTPELQKRLDSLWQVWKDNTKADTIRLKAMSYFISDGYERINLDSVFYYSQLQYDFAKAKNNKKYELFALDRQASSLFMMGEVPEAIEYMKRKITVLETYDDKNELCGTLTNTGMIYQRIGEYEKAIEYNERALKIAEEIDDKKFRSSIYQNLGNAYGNQGNYPKALEYYKRGLKIAEETDNKTVKLNSLGNIGNLYFRNNEFDNALDYLKQGLALAEEVSDKSLESRFYTNIALVYSKQEGHTDEMLEYSNKALKIAEDIGDKNSMGKALSILGSCYAELGQSKKALEYTQRGLSICEEIGDKKNTIAALQSIGDIYYDLDEHQKAVKSCQRGLDLAIQIGSLEDQMHNCRCLYMNFKSLGNTAQALNFLEETKRLENNMHTQETTKKLQQMEFDKQLLKDSIAMVEKERKIEEAHQAEVQLKDRNKNMAIAAGIFFLLVSGGFYSRYRYTKKAKSVIEKEKDRSENLLLNILPAEVAEELKLKGEAEAKDFDMVSILFTDFKSFTEQSEKLTASALVKEINNCFKEFDAICEKYNVEKIKTIGDAYMAAGGLPVPEDTSVKNTVLAALEMQDFIVKQHQEKEANGEHAFEMRVGIHTGPVVAGIVGVKKFQYDVWGDTVNTASRIESNGAVGKVNISETTYNYLKDDTDFVFESRGKVEAKGKGKVEMYFVSLV
ncbi:MAG: adenylate/guanylate cyclase domain-containing protein [Gelidibacter sp.]